MRILITDDHQNMIDSLKTILTYAFEGEKNVHILESLNCTDAILAIKKQAEANEPFDLAILDYSMPGNPEYEIFNDGDLCLFLREKMPLCKSFFFTAHLEDFTVIDLDQRVKPDAIIIKSDVSGSELMNAIKEVVKGNKYKSTSVLQKTHKMWEEEIFTKETNRKIVALISNGYKIKEIAEALSLSEVAIQKRIAKIKKGLNITDDTSILREIKRRGYL